MQLAFDLEIAETLETAETAKTAETLGTAARPGTGDYRAYTADTTPAGARAAFVRRYGIEPAEVTWFGGLLLVGPIPGRG